MNKAEALNKLQSIGQQHLLAYIDSLSLTQQNKLIEQIDKLNIPIFRQQQQLLVGKHPLATMQLFDSFRDFSSISNPKNKEAGSRLLSEGKVGCLLAAGGQGTRFRSDQPKGAYPLSIIKKKSLFQLFAEKVIAAGKRAGRQLPLAIMTSPLNHERTAAIFSENENYGLEKEQVAFFSQGMLPLLNEEGNLFLDRPHHIAVGPDGNGSSLQHFFHQGLWQRWYDCGIRYLNYVLIDNPLADPFDAELIGFHRLQGCDAAIKCTWRGDPKENVGIVVKHEDKVKVIEYTELPEEERTKRLDDGTLKHVCANLSMFSFSMDFIKKIANIPLPLHIAHKAVEFLTSEGITVDSLEPNGCKFESFIFDVLPYSLQTKALLYPREQCFSPLKNMTSLETVHMDLQQRDRQIITEITGTAPPEHPFELAQEFYYPTTELLERWKGRHLDLGEDRYISP
ncbi:MAG: UTP--glucose-1-phosphate uridylyltransferase [Waddliaceae bacterium]